MSDEGFETMRRELILEAQDWLEKFMPNPGVDVIDSLARHIGTRVAGLTGERDRLRAALAKAEERAEKMAEGNVKASCYDDCLQMLRRLAAERRGR